MLVQLSPHLWINPDMVVSIHGDDRNTSIEMINGTIKKADKGVPEVVHIINRV